MVGSLSAWGTGKGSPEERRQPQSLSPGKGQASEKTLEWEGETKDGNPNLSSSACLAQTLRRAPGCELKCGRCHMGAALWSWGGPGGLLEDSGEQLYQATSFQCSYPPPDLLLCFISQVSD